MVDKRSVSRPKPSEARSTQITTGSSQNARDPTSIPLHVISRDRESGHVNTVKSTPDMSASSCQCEIQSLVGNPIVLATDLALSSQREWIPNKPSWSGNLEIFFAGAVTQFSPLLSVPIR
jgi:hypothetical protein